MPSSELTTWQAYFNVEQKKEQERIAANERAQAEAIQRKFIMAGNDGKGRIK